MGKATSFVINGGVLSLGGQDLAGLLRAVLEKERSFRFRVKGCSMDPFLKDGDMVTVSPLFGNRPDIGEVVAFVHSRMKRLVIHRIVSVSDGIYVTKGDNTPEEDGAIAEKDILGRVTKVEKRGIVFSLMLKACMLVRCLEKMVAK